ncbi:MAG: phosphotransferase [Bacilli bacterium]
MRDQHERVAEVLSVAKQLGVDGISPVILGDAGNLIVHLASHPIVARVAKLFAGDDADAWRGILAREVRVARHLARSGAPIVPPAAGAYAGPHRVGDTWMTWWQFLPKAPLPPLDPGHAFGLVNSLASAMAHFPEPLPVLGVWETVSEAVGKLRLRPAQDVRIADLLRAFEKADERMRMLDSALLLPAHGDAHPRNLLPGPEGWRWIDFEDVSLMPRFWDLASFIGNSALLDGLRHPLVQYVLNHPLVLADRSTFADALTARAVMSTATNFELALEGHGDLAFAMRQLERMGDFLILVKHVL